MEKASAASKISYIFNFSLFKILMKMTATKQSLAKPPDQETKQETGRAFFEIHSIRRVD